MLLDKIIKRNWWQSKRGKPRFTGDVKIAQNSSLRKLARAMRRGKVPEERQFIIDEAMKTAQRRRAKYQGQGTPR